MRWIVNNRHTFSAVEHSDFRFMLTNNFSMASEIISRTTLKRRIDNKFRTQRL